MLFSLRITFWIATINDIISDARIAFRDMAMALATDHEFFRLHMTVRWRACGLRVCYEAFYHDIEYPN